MSIVIDIKAATLEELVKDFQELIKNQFMQHGLLLHSWEYIKVDQTQHIVAVFRSRF